jgi:enhancing lycopene biosynthesis protein 2
MSNVAVILAGSGVNDGSEIHEATLTLYFLDEAGANVQIFAPDRPQHHVVNHLRDHESFGEKRNILTESARIARGNAKPLNELNMNAFDAIIFPGGFGAAKNLCSYALEGANFSVHEDIANIITQAHEAKKVLGFICIAPVMAAKLIPGVCVTVGSASDTSKHIEQLGAMHQSCRVDEVVWDEEHRVASTPAYMVGTSIKDIGAGIKAMCEVVMANILVSVT